MSSSEEEERRDEIEESEAEFLDVAFMTLPTDALYEVLKKMTPESVVELCKINKYFANICSDEIVFRGLMREHYPQYKFSGDAKIAYLRITTEGRFPPGGTGNWIISPLTNQPIKIYAVTDDYSTLSNNYTKAYLQLLNDPKYGSEWLSNAHRHESMKDSRKESELYTKFKEIHPRAKAWYFNPGSGRISQRVVKMTGVQFIPLGEHPNESAARAEAIRLGLIRRRDE
jgi:hypothetical protein